MCFGGIVGKIIEVKFMINRRTKNVILLLIKLEVLQ